MKGNSCPSNGAGKFWDDPPMGEWRECNSCGGEGFIDHDCGDDTCNCLDRSEDDCENCGGMGGWYDPTLPERPEDGIDG